jgi:DNA-damage-inducible protein D
VTADLTRNTGSPFDAIRREDETGEFWSARDLMPLLGYPAWQHFLPVIERAAASGANQGRLDLFTVNRENSGGRPREDYRLSRFAAYLVAMNGDPRKREVAKAQHYFAIKTREAETAPPALELDPRNNEAHLRLILQASNALLISLDEEKAKVAELTPAAEAWDALAADSGDFSVREAAQALSRDEGISIGQNRLFVYLREIGWIDSRNAPYQSQVDAGRLVRRVTDYTDDFGQRFVRVQPRVTVKGLAELRKRLTPPPDGGLRLVSA